MPRIAYLVIFYKLLNFNSYRDEEIVCYRNVGCFRDEGPFDYLDTLPAPPETINTTFTLYTRKNPVTGTVVGLNNSTALSMSNFNQKNAVKIVIHGFGSTGRNSWVIQMTEALLFAVRFWESKLKIVSNFICVFLLMVITLTSYLIQIL